MDSEFVKLINKYSAKCFVCEEQILEGEEVLWKKGVGVKHEECVFIDFERNTKPISEWKDPNQYSMKELREKTHCQCCGLEVPNKREIYISIDRRVCEQCF